MANIIPIVEHDQHTPIVAGVNTKVNGRPKGSIQAFWNAVTSVNSQGVGVIFSQYSDKSVQLTGVFTTTTVLVEGSNDSTDGIDGSWATMTDPQGAALSFTAAGLRQLLENPKWIRPRASASGGATNVNVYLYGSTVRQA